MFDDDVKDSGDEPMMDMSDDGLDDEFLQDDEFADASLGMEDPDADEGDDEGDDDMSYRDDI